jgi:hypothetical protein
MSEHVNSLKHDPRKLCNAYFRLAKRWWMAVLLCKFSIVLIGALVVWLSVLSKLTPFVVFLLTVTSEWLLWRSDGAKATAESLLRKLDFRDGLGWEISRDELSDVLARTPAKMRGKIPPEGHQQDYFASRDEHGPKRALKNIQESAWWSKHLAEKMGQYTLAFTVVCVVGSLFILIVSLSTVANFDALSGVGRVVTSVLMLLLSLGLIRLTLNYYGFSRKAQRAEERVGELLKYGFGDMEAVKVYNEYHLSRAAAPLIPDQVWKWNQKYLNEFWEEYRND